MGDLLGFWYGRWITFAVRHLAKMRHLPAAAFQQGAPFARAVSASGSTPLAARHADSGFDSLPAVHGRNHGIVEGRGAHPSQHRWPRSCRAEAWFTRRWGSRRHQEANCVAALPLYHIFADSLPLTIRLGELTLIPICATFRSSSSGVPSASGGQYLVQCLAAAPAIQDCGFLAAVRLAGRRHGSFRGNGQGLAEGDRLRHGRGWGMSWRRFDQQSGYRARFPGRSACRCPAWRALAIKDDDGRSLAVGAAGEICIKGAETPCSGYYEQPGETRKAFTDDGYMRTGDVGVMDEQGYMRGRPQEGDDLGERVQRVPKRVERLLPCGPASWSAPRSASRTKTGRGDQGVRSDPVLTEEDVAAYCRAVSPAYKNPFPQVHRIPPTTPAQDQRGQDTPARSPPSRQTSRNFKRFARQRRKGDSANWGKGVPA